MLILFTSKNKASRRKQAVFFVSVFLLFGITIVASAKTINLGVPSDVIYVQGNLGVGTDIPNYTVDVAGSINFTGNLYKSGSLFSGSKWSSNATSIFYNTGNVGIGISNPSESLHVIGGAQFTDPVYGVTPGETDNLALATVEYVNVIAASAGDGGVEMPIGSIGQTMRHNGTAWVGNSVLYNNGTNVGVGNSSPTSKLTVSGPIEVSRDGIYGSYLSTEVQGIWSIGRNYPISTINNDFGELWGMAYGYMGASSVGSGKGPIADWGHQILFTGAGLHKAAISLTHGHAYFNGNVGIGTDNPREKLEIAGSLSFSGATDSGRPVLSQFSASPNRGLKYDAPGATSGWYGVHDFFTGYNGGASTLAMRIKNGNVGIGATNPTSSLHVLGGGEFTSKVFAVTPGETDTLALTTVEYVNALVGGSGGVGAGTNGQTLRHNGTAWVGNSTLYNNGTNVGVGTMAPSTKLSVAQSLGAGYTSMLTFDELTNSGANSMGIDWRFAGASGFPWGSVGRIEVARQTTSSNFDLVFHTSNVGTLGERMRILASGNVGIGVSSPQTRTHIWSGEVAGGSQEVLRLEGNWVTNPSGPLLRFTNQHNSGINPSSGEYNIAGIQGFDDTGNWGGSLYFQTVPVGTSGGGDLTTRMVIKANGNVGIGTTNPTRLFHVSGGEAQFSHRVFGATPGESDTLALATVEYVNNKVNEPIDPGDVMPAGSSGYTMRHNGTDWVGVSNLFNNGTNVGIGTTAPGADLEVLKNVANGQGASLKIINDGTEVGSGQIASLVIGRNFNDRNWKIRAQSSGSYGTFQDLIFSTNLSNGDGAHSDKIVFKNNGNVGIGMTNPSVKLEVDAGNSNTHAIFSGTYAGIQGIQVQRSGGSNVRLVANHTTYGGGLESSNALRFAVNGNSITAPSMFIKTDGNVGIGTTNPTRLLHVSGGEAQFTHRVFGATPGESDTLALATVEYVNNKAAVAGSELPTGVPAGSTLRHNGTSWIANTILYNDGTNIGINTTSPATKLSVVGGHSDTKMRLQANTGQTGMNSDSILSLWASEPGITYYGAGIGENINGHPNYGVINSNREGAALRFSNGSFVFQNLSTTGTINHRVTIASNGDTGIGIPSPTAKLDVGGTLKNSLGVIFSFFGGDGNRLLAVDNGGGLYKTSLTEGYSSLIIDSGIIYKRTPISNVNYTAQASDYIIAYTSLTADRTLTLPSSICTVDTVGKALLLVNETGTTYDVNVTPQSPALISGMTSIALEAYNSIPVYCNGTNWFIY